VRQALARNPILPLRLFRSRNLSGANIVQAVMGAAFFGFFFLGSLNLERVLRYGPMEIGLAFLPVAVGMGALSIKWSAQLIMRFGARTMVLVGLVLIVGGLVLLAQGPMFSNYLRDLLLPMALLGIGGGLAFPALTIVAMADATPSDSGLASGLLNTTMQIGASLGLAILATLSSTRTGQLIASGTNPVAALSGGFHLAWAIGAGMSVVAIVLAAAILRPTPATLIESSNVDDAGVESAREHEEVEVCA
jgi:MFS family permease